MDPKLYIWKRQYFGAKQLHKIIREYFSIVYLKLQILNEPNSLSVTSFYRFAQKQHFSINRKASIQIQFREFAVVIWVIKWGQLAICVRAL